ncbi:MAG TPA: hypothetical protein GXX19_06730 [Syntrophomonadaceae bacterium]|nr:hypothetical protein [Syntrophomonadaceae bacterium]
MQIEEIAGRTFTSPPVTPADRILAAETSSGCRQLLSFVRGEQQPGTHYCFVS